MDASPQAALGTPDSFNRAPDAMLQMVNGKRRCIREPLLGLRPDIFIGIDFRSVGGESMRMNPGMPMQENAHLAPAMNRSAIPYQFNRSPKLSQQLAQERNHFHSGDIASMELRIQSQAVATGRHRDARNNREPIPSVAVSQDRRFTDRRPCSPDGGNKQKPAFIKECQVCAPLPGLFLYGARQNVSNGRWRPRRVGWRAARAFEHSIATRLPRVARWLIRNSTHQRSSLQWRQFVSASTVRWDTLKPARHVSANRQGERADDCSDGKAVQVLTVTPNHGAQTVDSFETIGRRNSTRRRAVRQHREKYNRVVATRWLSACAALKLKDFHVVSWKNL
jgi:hypothetical protein